MKTIYYLNQKQASHLADYYHDLGVFLNFRDNLILGDYIFLNPEWATAAVYLLVENKNIQTNNGRFSYSELLEKYWKDKYPVNIYPQLLELMKKFELCFQISSSQQVYVVPELLSPSKPDFDWSYKNNLQFEFHYNFMPAGIVTRFTTRNHELIKNDIFWKNGVVLKSQNTESEALLISDQMNKSIKIWVRGKTKKELLAFIGKEIDEINTTLNNPKVFQMLPCICSECKISPDPYLWDYSILKKALSKNRRNLPCEHSFEDVAIEDIIDQILTTKNSFTDFLKNNKIQFAEITGAFSGAFMREMGR